MSSGFINTNSIIFTREKIDQRTDRWSNVLQPLIITFFYKCTAHTIINDKQTIFVPHTKNMQSHSYLSGLLKIITG